MFARAVGDYQVNSSQTKSSVKLNGSQVQKTLDFSGGKRKALDTIGDDGNKRIAVEPSPPQIKEKKSTLITALSKTNSFNDTKGQFIIDGEPFDEADFEDIGIDDWNSHPGSSSTKEIEEKIQEEVQLIGSKNAPITVDQDEDYFNDSFDMDWDAADLTKPLDGPIRSSPPIPKSIQSPIQAEQPVRPPSPAKGPVFPIEDKENTSPSPDQASPSPSPAPAPVPQAEEKSLATLLFPSSSQPIPWSSSPPRPPKRSLPWLTNPDRYGPPRSTMPTQTYKKEAQIKSIVRKDPTRNISTMTVETVDWSVLGLQPPKGILAKARNEEIRREREAERKAEEVKKAVTDWIDNPILKAETMGRRKKKEEVKVKLAVEKKKPVIAKVFLSQEQLSVRKLVVEDKKSVFFTGSAGTGKSVLLREIISGLKKAHERTPDVVAVTASTGLAACNVGGITLHSFASFGLGREPVEDLAKKIRKNKKGFDRWRRTKVLIIDEISMVDAGLFDKLEALARVLRKDQRPFGGIQLVVTGDFFQLPPVPDGGREARFTFEAQKWKECIPHTIKLTNVFRQKDQEFVTMLNEMRLGRLSKDSIEKFRALERPMTFNDNIEPTELFPTRNEVDYANNTRLRALPGSVHKFIAEEGGAIVDPKARERILQGCMAPQVVELKKDAQVMLIKNMDENLVNGSLGRVIGFMSESTYSLCEREGIDVETAMDFEVQGASDDPYGFKTLDEEDGDSQSVLRKKNKLLKLRGMASSTAQLWPLVRFTTAAGYHIDRLITRERWATELPDGEVQAYRRQIPLILAYAISIHKAQGQTLSRVRVDLGKVFEKGQAYVALSRATSREGLQILRFQPSKVMAHPKVAGFYRSLEGVDESKEKAYEMPKRHDWIAKALEKLAEPHDKGPGRDLDGVNEDEEEAAYGYG